jgi:hypothetical protein
MGAPAPPELPRELPSPELPLDPEFPAPPALPPEVVTLKSGLVALARSLLKRFGQNGFQSTGIYIFPGIFVY